MRRPIRSQVRLLQQCHFEQSRPEELFRFEQLWNNLAPNVRVFDVPEAVQQKLLRYTPATKPTWNKQAEFDTRTLPKNLTFHGMWKVRAII